MGKHYQALLEKINEIHDLEKSLWILSWDREVNMPSQGSAVRTQQMTTLRKLHHQLYTADKTGELIENAESELNGASYDSTEASLVRYLKRDYAETKQIPEDYVRRVSEVNGKALPAWKEAREQSDFSIFAPHLAAVIELSREEVEYREYEDEKYDALLKQYERGMTTADVRAVFDAVKEAVLPLIQAISEKNHLVDDSALHQPFDVNKQKETAPYFARAVGYDFDKGHLGTAAHPFAASFSRNDARITTRWNPNFLNPFLFGVMHECGHAMYEQGTGPELERTPLARGTSMGIHESQSRMFENLVGRSRGFWNTHYNHLQNAFPQQLGSISLEQFYRAINKVQPSFIRVEADELTYNMHIILRFELEQAMLNGDLEVNDVPTAWNDKMAELLGVTPANDAVGCLQDIHWTRPSFGYFPTYALGNFYSAQILEAAIKQSPQIETELARGQVDALHQWLRENIHQHGKKYDSAELITRATGRPLTHEPFVAYAHKKFGEIYQL
ncbi:MAG: carboxypeptidase M32 [Ardenticatenaceae bacterium]|nr:carboxypeptidase M32 [Ardenticatenaceae bacterium]